MILTGVNRLTHVVSKFVDGLGSNLNVFSPHTFIHGKVMTEFEDYCFFNRQ